MTSSNSTPLIFTTLLRILRNRGRARTGPDSLSGQRPHCHRQPADVGADYAAGNAASPYVAAGNVEQRHYDRLGDVAATLGCMYCPNGFRILSNFGYDGLQSQSHGHLHVIGGQYLGHYA